MITGLSINFHKTQLIGINISDELARTLASMLGCKISSLPTRYLEISLHHSKFNKANCSFLSEKIIEKLSGWKQKLYPWQTALSWLTQS